MYKEDFEDSKYLMYRNENFDVKLNKMRHVVLPIKIKASIKVTFQLKPYQEEINLFWL